MVDRLNIGAVFQQSSDHSNQPEKEILELLLEEDLAPALGVNNFIASQVVPDEDSLRRAMINQTRVKREMRTERLGCGADYFVSYMLFPQPEGSEHGQICCTQTQTNCLASNTLPYILIARQLSEQNYRLTIVVPHNQFSDVQKRICEQSRGRLNALDECIATQFKTQSCAAIGRGDNKVFLVDAEVQGSQLRQVVTPALVRVYVCRD